jgi:hypothetical protein
MQAVGLRVSSFCDGAPSPRSKRRSSVQRAIVASASGPCSSQAVTLTLLIQSGRRHPTDSRPRPAASRVPRPDPAQRRLDAVGATLPSHRASRCKGYDPPNVGAPVRRLSLVPATTPTSPSPYLVHIDPLVEGPPHSVVGIVAIAPVLESSELKVVPAVFVLVDPQLAPEGSALTRGKADLLGELARREIVLTLRRSDEGSGTSSDKASGWVCRPARHKPPRGCATSADPE